MRLIRRSGSYRCTLVVVLCASLFVACAQPVTVVENAQAGGPELWSNFRDKLDADQLPATFDSGQTATIISSPASLSPVIRGGAYTFVPTLPGAAASYYEGRVKGRVQRIRVRFGFDVGRTTGARMAVAILNDAMIGFSVPGAATHLIVGPEDWSYGVIDPPPVGENTPQPIGSRLQTIRGGKFPTPLSLEGTAEHEMNLVLNGSTAKLDIDGQHMAPITDSRIGDPHYAGSHVFFECYFTAGDTDNRPKFFDIAAW